MFTTIIDGTTVRFDEALVAKYDRPGPRYTSYPTAPAWRETLTSHDHAAALRASNAASRPLSMYLHLPFCESHCTFCGCNVIITKQKTVVDPYLDDLERELALLAQHVDGARPIVQLHWGGGTPTYCSPAQLARLWQMVTAHWRFAPDAEIGIEVDPRVTTVEHITVLRELGFNRISMGIQDFAPEVQAAINRIQPKAMTAALIAACRTAGFASVNVDLIYGLPHQTPEGFAATTAAVIALRPDRIALYNFAYVPWLKVHQQHIDPATLPAPATKLTLLLEGIAAFSNAGYRFIGMDHFARPDDELARALDTRTLWRNFQGYTTKAGTDLVAAGITAISDVDGRYAQNVKTLAAYRRAVADGQLPIERGAILSADDLLRRTVIRELLCNNYVAKAAIAEAYAIDSHGLARGNLPSELCSREGGTRRALPASSEKGNRERDVFAGVHGTPFATSRGGASLLRRSSLGCEGWTQAPVIDFDDYFRAELAALAPMADDGLVEITAQAMRITPTGRLFARNVAMVFDKYLETGSRPIYSRTI